MDTKYRSYEMDEYYYNKLMDDISDLWFDIIDPYLTENEGNGFLSKLKHDVISFELFKKFIINNSSVAKSVIDNHNKILLEKSKDTEDVIKLLKNSKRINSILDLRDMHVDFLKSNNSNSKNINKIINEYDRLI